MNYEECKYELQLICTNVLFNKFYNPLLCILNQNR